MNVSALGTIHFTDEHAYWMLVNRGRATKECRCSAWHSEPVIFLSPGQALTNLGNVTWIVTREIWRWISSDYGTYGAISTWRGGFDESSSSLPRTCLSHVHIVYIETYLPGQQLRLCYLLVALDLWVLAVLRPGRPGDYGAAGFKGPCWRNFWNRRFVEFLSKMQAYVDLHQDEQESQYDSE